MNVNLGDHFENYVVGLVNSGLYQSQSEVVRESLRLLQQQQAFHEQKLSNLRNAIDLGVKSLKEGEAISLQSEADIDLFFDRLMQGSRK